MSVSKKVGFERYLPSILTGLPKDLLVLCNRSFGL